MILVHALRILHTAIQRRHKVLREPDERLDQQQDVGDEPQDGVRGLEMRPLVCEFVDLDDHEAGDGGGGGGDVQPGVGVGSLLFLRGRVGWLQNQYALDVEEDGGGVEELWIVSISRGVFEGILPFSW